MSDESAVSERPAAKLLRYTKLFVGGLLLGLVLMFVSQNADPATVHFFSWHFELSLSLLIFFVLLIGIVVGVLIAGWLRWRRSHRRDV